MLDALKDYDWAQVFGYAGETGTDYDSIYGSGLPSRADGSGQTAEPVTREDVVEVIYMKDGERDESHWDGCFRLTGNRFMWISAGCDYTGWD